jgi:NADH-quinone oxidoreductase subunit G
MCLVMVGTPAVDRATGKPELDADGNPVIRFFPKPMTACTTPVSPGMKVVTQSEESVADRTAVLEFLLTSHPLDCPICDKGGECPLQDLTYSHGPGKSRFNYEAKHHGPKKVPLGDLIVLDTERCVICARCVRFQDELAGDPVLAIENRGRDAKIVTYSDPPFDSHFSGNTTDICPVGALTSRDFRFGARAWEMVNIPSISAFGSMGDNIVLGTRIGAIKRIMPRQNEVVNEIWISDKTRFGHHFTDSPNRLTTPLIKQNGQFVEASWNDALSLIADKFASADGKIGGIAGAHLSNEDLYLFQKLFREVLKSPHIDHRVGLSSAIQDELAYEVGVGVGTDIGRLRKGTVIFNLGSDLDEEAPTLFLRVRTAARNGAYLINAGGRWTKLDSVAQSALRYRYGTAAQLVWGMVAAILEDGLENKDFVAGRVKGLDDLKTSLKDFSPATIANGSGVSEAQIRAAAKTFAEAENGIILYGAEAGNDPSLKAALRSLALITGHAGRANNGVTAILPHANSRGAVDFGILPDRLPGYVKVEGEPGMSAHAMLTTKSGLKALYIAAADVSAESEAYRAALGTIDFVVVQDLFMTETAKQADVILPAKGTYERDGSYTNIDRRVQAFDAGVPSPGLAWADWLIISAIAGRLGADWGYASADGVMAEITQTVSLYNQMHFSNLLTPITVERHRQHYIYAGMSFTSDVREGLQWSTQAEKSDSSFDLRFVAPAETAKAEWLVVTPHVLYDGGVLISQSEMLLGQLEQPKASFSRLDAEKLGVKNGDTVTLTSAHGSVTLPVRTNRLLPEGVISIPRNLSGAPAEKLLGGEGVTVAVEVSKVSVQEPV